MGLAVPVVAVAGAEVGAAEGEVGPAVVVEAGMLVEVEPPMLEVYAGLPRLLDSFSKTYNDTA